MNFLLLMGNALSMSTNEVNDRLKTIINNLNRDPKGLLTEVKNIILKSS